MSTADVNAVLAQFPAAGQIERLQPLDMAGGWSGSLIWRVTTVDGWQLCLRRWPPAHPTPDRLRLIHTVLTHAAAQGIDFLSVPLTSRSGDTIVRHDGHLWELSTWLPGQADYHQNPSRPRLAAAMQALARFHQASVGIGDRGSGVGDPGIPAIAERLALVNELHAGDFDRIAAATSGSIYPGFDTRAGAILSLTRDRLPALRAPLAAAAQMVVPLQPAIRDVHHDHILFTGERVTGLIDFGALRIDTPLADVARLVGSLVGDDAPAREFALAAYGAVRPLSDQDLRLIDLLDASNVVLSGLNWIRWLYLDRRDMGPPDAILRRLDEIIARLKVATTHRGP